MAKAATVHVRLTERQMEILEAIDSILKEQGFAPSAREITRKVGLAAVSTTHAHLQILRDKGAVAWAPGLPRTLHITAAGYDALDKRVL